MFERKRRKRAGVTETFSRAFARLVTLVTKADLDSHAEAVRRYAHMANGDDLTVGESTVPAATLLPNGHEGMDEAEIEFGFRVTGVQTDSRRREASGGGKGEIKDNLLGTGADVGLNGRLLFGKDYSTSKNSVGVIHCKAKFTRQPIPDGLRLIKEHALEMQRAELERARRDRTSPDHDD